MKTITIGDWDGDKKTITVEDNCTVSQALELAGLTRSQSQSITRYSDAETVNMNETVFDSETYLLTGNQTSG